MQQQHHPQQQQQQPLTWAALAQQAVPIKQTTKSTGSSSAVAKPVSAGSSSGATPTVKSWLP